MDKKILETILTATQMLPEHFVEALIVELENRIGIVCGGVTSNCGESVIFDLLLTLNRDKLTIFDVGANRGQYATEAVSRLSNIVDFSIHCFEPSKKTFQFLSDSHRNNNKIVLNNFGLAEQRKEAPLFMDTE
jgi:hypothetical protein